MSATDRAISPTAATAKRWDIVVVGAGPAGAVMAQQCARQGAQVLLIDRDAPPRPKVCGGCLGAAGIALLNEIGLGSSLDRSSSAQCERIQIASGRHQVNLPIAPGRVVLRQDFDRALIEAAVRDGAAFLPESSATGSLASENGQQRDVTIRCSNGSHVISAKCVIAADGLGGRFTSDALGPDHVRRRSRFGVGALVHCENGYDNGIVHMAMGKGGYIGVVRANPTTLIVAGALKARSVRKAGSPGTLAARLLARSGFEPIDALAQAQWKGTPGLTRRRSRVAAHRLLAIGDTNGYAEPITGEGMTWAIASAIAAAPLALRSIDGWDRHIERDWTRRHRRVIRSRQRTGRLLHHALNHDRACTLVIAQLSAVPQIASLFLSRLSRPYSVPV
jgi:flavin-dependent dehydrogenase